MTIKGILNAEGTTLVSLPKTSFLDIPSPPLPCQETGIFRLEFEDESGLKHLFFDALVASDSDILEHGFFELTVPVEGSVVSLSIIDVRSNKTIHYLIF